MSKKIEIKCKGNRYLSRNLLKSFQGNLKEISKESAKKLRQSILGYGWIAPIFVWNKDYILDGHGRLLILNELIKEGYSISDLPIVDIEAKTKKEAAQILLAINSKYQNITDDGLYEFMHEMDLKFEDLENFDLPDIDIEKIELLTEIKEMINPYKKVHILLSFAPDKFIEIKELIEQITKVGEIEYEQSSN